MAGGTTDHVAKGGMKMFTLRQILKLHFVLLAFQLLSGQMSYGQSTDLETSEAGKLLKEMAAVFREKIDEQFSVIVQFEFIDTNESWYVIVEKDRKVTVHKGPHEKARYFFTTTIDTLRLIRVEKLDAMTAASKATGADHAPLDLKLADGLDFTPDVRKQLYTFFQHFFNPTVPEKKLLGEEYSRLVHGGHVIALYYYPGFRSAWYLLKNGDQLNEPGDTNPFPQAFIIIEGKGYAKIGDKTIHINARESYYIPPNSDHIVWTEKDESLVLIWLAWGEGA